MFRNKDYVLEVYRERSFSRAAEKLYVSQPSLSASVKRIEERIGAPIFDRSISPIDLTEIGKEYVRIAIEIEGKEKDFVRYIEDRAKLKSGSIKIGGSSMFSSFVIPELAAQFGKNHPNIDFEIFEDSTKNAVDRLLLGELDLIIDNAKIEDAKVDSYFYSAEMLLLAVPCDFEICNRLKGKALSAEDIKRGKHLTKKATVSLSDFSGEPFIFLHPENDTGRRARELFKKHALTPNVIFYLDQQVTSYNVSASGMGISFVSDTLIKAIAPTRELCFFTLEDEQMQRSIFLYTKKNRYLSRAVSEFIKESTQK